MLLIVYMLNKHIIMNKHIIINNLFIIALFWSTDSDTDGICHSAGIEIGTCTCTLVCWNLIPIDTC